MRSSKKNPINENKNNNDVALSYVMNKIPELIKTIKCLVSIHISSIHSDCSEKK